MLKAVDKAVLMQDRDGSYMKDLVLPDPVRVEGTGPKAWNEVMLSILSA
jgi:hypothetical protein